MTSPNEPTPAPEALSIGDCSTLDVSGARNALYAIPGLERDDGIPHVFVWSVVGSGQPAPAYHGRWLCLGSVSQRAVAPEIERVVRDHEGEILSALETYQGTRWDGHNHVGTWATDPYGAPVELPDLEDALGDIPTYWDAGDWFQPVTFAEIAWDWAGADVDAAVAHEVNDARENNAWLEAGNVRSYLLNQARYFLEYGNGEAEPEAMRIARAWLAPEV